MSQREMRQIMDFPYYFATDDGRIWTTKRKGGNNRVPGKTGQPSELKPSPDRHGYLRVSLDRDGKVHTRCVHQIILETFVGPRPNGMEACHYPDSDKANNRLTNLRWDTHAENIKDRRRDRPAVSEKACRKCGLVKSLDEFYADTRASDGRKSDCKPCHSKVSIDSRDPEKKRAANREYMRRIRAQ